jgi:xylulokinase
MGFLVIDLGTSNCRAVFIDEGGNCNKEERAPVKVSIKGPYAEIDTDEAWKTVCVLVKRLLRNVPSKDIDVVGIGALLGYVYLDSKDQPIKPAFIWMDTRADREALEMTKFFSEDFIYAVTGRRISPELLAPQIRWSSKHDNGVFRKIRRIIGLKDELVRRLTGEIVTDYSHMNYSMLCDYRNGKVDDAFVAWTGLKRYPLPNAVPAQTIIGEVNRSASVLTGLPQGIPVICGTSDGTAAMYGGGILVPNTAVLVSGTTDVLMALTARPLSGCDSLLSINTGMIVDTYAVGGASGLAGGTLRPLSALFGMEVSNLIEQAEKIPAGSEGLLLLPGFTGERSPYWKSYLSGGVLGWTPTHGPAHFTRALFESCSYRILRWLLTLRKTKINIGKVNIVGGGSRINLWNQIKADVCGISLTQPREIEATALGIALLCRLGVDKEALPEKLSESWIVPQCEFSPDERRHAYYGELFALFEHCLENVDEIYWDLEKIQLREHPEQ